ncbi:MAG: heparinase II/III family protein [Gemmatimonadaceae bacterium]
MSLLLSRDALAARTQVARGPLRGLATSLRDDLYRAIPSLDIWIPPEKARLSRQGGRCRIDGTLLSFAPDSPHTHRCPACGAVFSEPDDYRWWIMNYQLWLAERAVHAATLSAVLKDQRSASIAVAILTAYADHYLTYPNNDNVLGPTRPFFSTYLESIWLLQLTVALDLLECRTTDRALGDSVRARLIAPSADLIRSYDEAHSNRQVWNNAALAAAAIALGDARQLEHAVHGPSGLRYHLEHALLSDGTWYEGENYHLFAHRGLWYGVQIAEHAGHVLPAALTSRFQAGFATPFLTALPDLTFPARRDSQYGVSLRQWRIAESCELGLARQPDDEALQCALRALYDPPATVADGDTGRASSTAEAERNHPGVRLSRASLGWKSLLCAKAELPPLKQATMRSVLLPAQGLAVVRRDAGETYVALDYGHGGNGHGHPDRLNLWLVKGADRVLEDVGTGSYTAPSLHWYRSTLAHNAPLVDGVSQERVDGELLAFDDDVDVTTVSAEAHLAAGVTVRRSIQVFVDAVVDTVEWTADRSIRLELPIHVVGDITGVARWMPSALRGGATPEDGFSYLSEGEQGDDVAPMIRVQGAGGVVAHLDVAGCELFRATAPGPPGREPRPFLLLRAVGRSGRLRGVWTWQPRQEVVTFEDAVSIAAIGQSYHVRTVSDGWQIEVRRGGSVRQLNPVVRRRHPESRPPRKAPPTWPILLRSNVNGREARFELGETSYRRSELPWREAGAPQATVQLRATDEHFVIDVRVAKASPWFAPAAVENPLDNEHPDINSDGLQLYIGTQEAMASWLLVPESDTRTMRVTPRSAPAERIPLQADAHLSHDGWETHLSIRRSDLANQGRSPFAFNLVVNESPGPPIRERRRGQLVLSGSPHEWIYLRGDREDPARALTLMLVDD